MAREYNKHYQRGERRALRNRATEAETILWKHLSGNKMAGRKFRRQQGIGQYIVDFYCPELRLAIEIDGPYHQDEDAQAHDRLRQECLEKSGIRFLRFTNDQIENSLIASLHTIIDTIKHIESLKQQPPTPGSSGLTE